jgi:hypothetical protein
MENAPAAAFLIDPNHPGARIRALAAVRRLNAVMFLGYQSFCSSTVACLIPASHRHCSPALAGFSTINKA